MKKRQGSYLLRTSRWSVVFLVSAAQCVFAQSQHPVTLLSRTCGPSGEQTQRMYFVPSTNGPEALVTVRDRLVSAGASGVTIFYPRVVVADMPFGVDVHRLLEGLHVDVLPDGAVFSDEQAEIFSPQWVKACYRRFEALSATTETMPIENDALTRRIPESEIWRSVEIQRARAERSGSAQDERLIFQNSEFLAGRVAMQIVLPESNGGTEDWTDAALNQAAQLTVLSILFYEQVFKNVSVEFSFLIFRRSPTGTEPILYSMLADSTWVADVMANRGFPGTPSEYLQAVHEFNNQGRRALGADWVFTVFIVNSANDSDHMFQGARNISYSYLGGPFFAVPYPPGPGGGSDAFMQLVKHEISSIFWALEESVASPTTCDDYSGYLNIQNLNKVKELVGGIPKGCTPQYMPEPCVANINNMMDGYLGPPCDYSMAMLGNIDANRNNVPDVFDAPPVVAFAHAAVETLTTIVDAKIDFTVTARPVTNRNPLQPAELRRNYATQIKDVSITLGGIGPYLATPIDGQADEIQEEYEVSIDNVLPGYTTLEVVSRNSFGATSAKATKRVYYIGLDYFGFGFEQRNEGIGVVWHLRGETFDADLSLYRIEYSNGVSVTDTVIASGLQPIGPVEQGGLLPYYFLDRSVAAGTVYGYYIVGTFELLYKGKMTMFAAKSEEHETIAAFPRVGSIVSAPSPNPFNPVRDVMHISIEVPVSTAAGASLSPAASSAAEGAPEPTGVKVEVFDVTGRFVKTLLNDRVYNRVLTLAWDGTNEKGEVTSTGIYFIKAQAGHQRGCKKVLVLR